MNVNSIIFSPCGGTRKVMQAVLQDVAGQIKQYDLTLPGARNEVLSFPKEDFVFLGFPVYGGRLPKNAEKVFHGIKGNHTPCALIAVYGNRAFDGALLDMHKLATTNGFVPVAAIAAIAEHSLAPQLASGRPDAEDRAKLSAWGRKITTYKTNGMKLVSAPGAYPDWVVPAGASPFPETDIAKCTRCGICVEVCPTAAIPADKPYLTDDVECIACGACAKYCPENARVMGNEAFHEFGRPHLVEAAKRKEPELFYDQQTN